MALVLGAAQLAIVAGTSYQGGASSIGSGGGPTSISMGERANRVNLANANNAAGELAFMRGERGIGRIENFRPAFGGYKMNVEKIYQYLKIFFLIESLLLHQLHQIHK